MEGRNSDVAVAMDVAAIQSLQQVDQTQHQVSLPTPQKSDVVLQQNDHNLVRNGPISDEQASNKHGSRMLQIKIIEVQQNVQSIPKHDAPVTLTVIQPQKDYHGIIEEKSYVAMKGNIHTPETPDDKEAHLLEADLQKELIIKAKNVAGNLFLHGTCNINNSVQHRRPKVSLL